MNNKDKRRSKRVKKTLHIQCRIYATTDAWGSAVVQDISQTGLSFVSRKEFPVGAILEIKIVTFLRKQPINIIGRLISCQKKMQDKNWITRISITHINEYDKNIFKQTIKMFLETLQEP